MGMHHSTERDSHLCVRLLFVLMLACVARASIQDLLRPSSQWINDNNLSGSGRNDQSASSDGLSSNSGSGFLSNSNDQMQEISSGNRLSDLLSVSLSGSGSAQLEGETSTTGKREADIRRKRDLPSRAICEFEYEENEDMNRLPSKLMFAKEVHKGINSCIDPNTDELSYSAQGSCQMVMYTMQVQTRQSSSESWQNTSIKVPVARICARDKEI
ncbi:uncharacterized protein LOC110982403 [Acanthaster planci]|uniref:Uncharacterized protein LOC110982403 n=1 Tax=Acanthaster planci TaxID=133434 RepID=A0A8B7YT54_ACAPL|nr:uncharacterized protein LOC110982403 [Acanthaster planci]